MPREAYFRNWMSAVAQAAEVTGAVELDQATSSQMTKAWGMVAETAGISRPELAEHIATEAKLAVADLDGADAHATHVVPAALAWHHVVLPLRCTDREVHLATANPLDQEAKREVAAMSGRSVRFEIAPPEEIVTRLRAAYGEPSDGDSVPVAPYEVPRPGGPHVLIVDDEAGARALFRSVLEEAGFRVTLARDGHEAMAALADEADYDLVSLDYFMEGMNGLRVLQLIRARAPHRDLPVIMVTGASDRRIEMSLFEAGADDFIVKPIDAPLFLLRIQAVLRRRRLR